ncbi:hypothetical protein [Paenibacillus hamazuiensis]|uniref:hypothetical protein n=1 Tax=Paenibacillus hamazuiensis TaxID=2936508 RepID=UPI00200FCD77|nr:hypothetical protein [Paenibacillus hamazuiensis]
MDNFRNKYRSRYYLARVSLFGTVQFHPRSPLIIALWSAAFPGFGHLLLHKFLRGYSLFVWELYINQKTLLNTAMMYTFTGNFQMAKAVLNVKLVYLYIPVYLFAIWDSYRTAVDENKLYLLAKRENAPFPTITFNPLEINYLDKKKPWIAAFWSMTVPSLGQLYIHRIVSAVFTLVITLLIVINSNFIEGLHYFFMGDFRKSGEIVGAQWLLYFPSIYFFGIYDAYINTVNYNKLFDYEQSTFLKRKYQPPSFVIEKGEKCS